MIFFKSSTFLLGTAIVITSLDMKITVFWNAMLCRLLRSWRLQVPLKYQELSTTLHGILTQSTAIFFLDSYWN
jgi:hypothetical protein